MSNSTVVNVTQVFAPENFFLLEYTKADGEEEILPLFGNTWEDVSDLAFETVMDDTGHPESHITFIIVGTAKFNQSLN
jgi:hypothetical protein